MDRIKTIVVGLALMAVSSGAQALGDLLAPPPASVCVAPTAPTEPGNVHMFPGRWWNPQRNGIGWDFFYNDGQSTMYLTWFTYDAAGRPVWLHGSAEELQFNAITGERTWQSRLYAAEWTFSTSGRIFRPAGSVSVTFPNQTTTRAAVRWRWDEPNTIGQKGIEPVGGAVYDECIFDTFRDQRALRLPESVINQAFSSNWFFRGLENDPLVGWGVDLLVDVNPADNHYIETVATAIFDVNGRPTWLQSKDDWNTTPPADDTLTSTDKGKLRYYRYTLKEGAHPAITPCPGDQTDCGPRENHDPEVSDPEFYGKFGRRIEAAATGRMALTAQVSHDLTGIGAIDWPPPNVSQNPDLPVEVPVMRFDANHVVVDKSVCRVASTAHTCTFQVSWSSNDTNAIIRRLDLNNGGAPTQIAGGLSSILPDTLPVGARVRYEISYRYNGTGPLTVLRTPEVRVLLENVIADANVENIACEPLGNNGCDLAAHQPNTGAISGEATSEGGAAMYSIPITVPPGRKGVEPKLALTYNSRSGNGIAGLGWSLSGFSAIHRCPRTIAEDGAGNSAPVSMSAGDALCLDGQRLVRTDIAGNLAPSQSYGVGGAHYRTEINNFARVTQYGGDLAAELTCFKVEDKSGGVTYYGGVPNGGGSCSGGGSREIPHGLQTPLSWNVERYEDASGNSIRYAYNASSEYGSGEKLVKFIYYTGKGSNDGTREVRFSYLPRPSADQARSFIAGGMTERTQRLTGISTLVNLVPVSTYTLIYKEPLSLQEGNLHSGRSALQRIRQCGTGGTGNNGAEVCLPDTVVEWNDLPPDHVFRPLTIAGLPEPAAQANGAFQDRRVELIGDLDGDGVRETLVYQHEADGRFHTWLVKHDADRALKGKLDIRDIAGDLEFFADGMQADFDGDGRTDILAGDDGGTLRLYRWNLPRGENFATSAASTFAGTTLGTVFSGQLVSTDDRDGDGLSDLLLRRRGSCTSLSHEEEAPGGIGMLTFGQLLCFYRNTSTPSGAVSFATGIEVHHWDYPTTEGGLSAVGDLNGDGKTDLAIRTETIQPGGPVDAITTVLLSAMPGMSLPSGCSATTTSGPVQWYACTPLAMNLPTSGTGYRTTGAAMRWHDVNGDGLTDLLYALRGECSGSRNCARGSWHVQIANGRGFNTSVLIGGNTDALLMTTGMRDNHLRYAGLLPSADLDSDGKADLLYPVALAARHCMASSVGYDLGGEDSCAVYDDGLGGGLPTESSDCAATVWMCGNDPAADINGTAGYSLPDVLDMPEISGDTALTTDNVYSPRARNAEFVSTDQSLYVMAGLRFVATSTGYAAQSFSLDSSGGSNRAAHRVTMTLGSAVAINTADDLYGDGLTDLTTRAGCFNQEPSGTRCRYVGDGITGPATYATGPTLNAGAVLVNVSDLNSALRTFVNENVGTLEITGGAPTLPGLVNTITNGFGDTASWTYSPLASRGFRTSTQVPLYTIPDAGYVDGNHFYFRSTMPVVNTLERSTGVGGTQGFRSWRYSYSEAMYNRLGRGFQGFRAILSDQFVLGSDAGRALREVTRFHQKFPLVGNIELKRVGSPPPSGMPIVNYVDHVRPFSEESYEWGCHRTSRAACTTSGVPAVSTFDYPFLNKQVTTTYDPGRAEQGHDEKVSRTTIENFAAGAGAASGWDEFGNLKNTRTVSEDFAETTGALAFVISKVTSRSAQYSNTTTPVWWPGKLVSTDDTIEAVQYNTALHPLPGDVALAAQTLHTRYDWNNDRTPAGVFVEESDPALRLETAYTYPAGSNNYGMPTHVSQDFRDPLTGGTIKRGTETVYSADGYFPARTYDAAGIATDFVYRPRDGQVYTTTLATGVRTYQYYDAFGRNLRTDAYKVVGANELPFAQSVHTAWNRCDSGLCNGVGSGGVKADSQPAEQHAAYRVTTVQNGTPTRVVWHDMLGREIKSAVRGFDGTFIATLSEYDTMGALSRKSVPFFLVNGGTAAPFTSTFAYDRAGRLTRKTSPDGRAVAGALATATYRVTSDYSYAGNRTEVALSNNRSCAPLNLCVGVTRYSGVLGLMRTQDAKSGTTRYWADAAGRPVAIADANSNAIYPVGIPSGRVTRAVYNKLGHRTNAVDPNQGSWSFVYSAVGEVALRTDARGITTTTSRDEAGRPLSQTSAIPAFMTSSAEHYRDEWTYEAGTGLLGEVRRCIAGSAPSACSGGPGGNATWSERYVYSYGRMTSATTDQRVPNNTLLTHATLFHHDANFGREKAVEYASGLKVQRIFTKFGALRDVIDGDTGERFWGVGGMDAFGNVTRQDYGNGVFGEYTYDPITGRPASKKWSRYQGGSVLLMDRVDYGYDTLANLSEQRRISGSGISINAEETYEYDELQRLTYSRVKTTPTAASVPTRYDYDALGNLTRKSDFSLDQAGAYEYTAAGTNQCGPNVATTVRIPQLDEFDRLVSQCDFNGNVIRTELATSAGSNVNNPSRQIRYDATNRPRAIADTTAPGGPRAGFTYAPDGRRVYEVLSETYVPSGSGATALRNRFIVMGQRGYQVELVSDANGWIGAQYRHELGDVSVVLREYPGQPGLRREIGYKPLDRLGSPLGVMHKNGEYVQRNESGVLAGSTQLAFSPFGSAREPNFSARTGTNQMPGRINLAPITRLGFTRHEHLDSHGLIHMNGRVFDHRLGRFLSVDPFIQFPANSQSLNPYSYVMNNPMAGTDPTGYRIRSRQYTPPSGETCMGDENCEYKQTMAGPVSSVRNTIRLGGAPSNAWNGRENPSIIPKVYKVLGIGSVTGTVSVAVTATIAAGTDSMKNAEAADITIGFDGAGSADLPGNLAIHRLGKQLGASMYDAVAIKGGPIDEAINEVVEKLKKSPAARVFLFGYSAGGQAAFDTARALDELGIPVQGLVTFDPHHQRGLFGFRKYDMPLNVGTALNFFQNRANPFKGGPANPGGGPINPNIDLSGTTDHVSIVDDVLNNGAYREQILSTLGR